MLIESFHLSGHTFRFRLQENFLSSVITQTVPLECTHQELSFEWSHLWKVLRFIFSALAVMMLVLVLVNQILWSTFRLTGDCIFH